MKQIVSFWRTRDKYILISIIFSLSTCLIIVALFTYYYRLLPPQIPLFYSLAWGQSELADKQQFLLLPIIAVLITLTNVFVSSQIHSSHAVIKKILTGSLFLINLIILVTAIRIIFIFV